MARNACRFLLLLLLAVAAVSGAVQTGSVTTSDGVRIVYDVRGNSPTTLLFIHCWSCDRTFWRNQADEFAKQYRVVTLDLGGHGESGRNRKNWTILGLGGDVQAVADKLKLKRIILVGHSMGGEVALEAARRLKGRVIGVIAVDTLNSVDEKVTPEMMAPYAAKMKADFPKAIASFMGGIVAKSSDPAVKQWIEQKASSADPGVAIPLFRDFANLDLKKMFAEAGVPIRGINAKPPYSGPTTIEANRKYADYDAVLLDDVGHFIQLERPKEFNQHLSRFAAELTK